MFHVDNESGVSTMPPLSPVSSATTKFFTENPPTYPGADWFNIVQMELINAITGCGIVLDKSSVNQLAEALSTKSDIAQFSYSSPSANHYLIRLPNGIVLQGGYDSTDINGYKVVSLPVAMSSYNVFVGEGFVSRWSVDGTNTYAGLVIYGTEVINASSFGFRSKWWQGASKSFVGGAATGMWLAIGRA